MTPLGKRYAQYPRATIRGGLAKAVIAFCDRMSEGAAAHLGGIAVVIVGQRPGKRWAFRPPTHQARPHPLSHWRFEPESIRMW
jgi:hypothetical protein